ncbi:MAG: DNA polymerase III subunit epsilon [Thiofilum sp.]|uniref:DNA polymerase III subunit epsilon n=1 Tax=Thiofilum sp. TaxID=2212733 RepID=UPI0025DC1CB6|nr:DNA polymerase III subunit epsilon [Thiofilum sp.]MBK8453568.1 DNA polymerase III subunit epsilon [Thiofilum sp.]
MRQLILDTETTGLDPQQGHRLIEIGCIELIDRQVTGRNFHYYLQPDREIDAEAIAVHGITNEFLQDKPRFKEVVPELMEYLRGAELIIHNAPFDVGFIENELRLVEFPTTRLSEICSVTDTLVMARNMYPGQRNSLDALCKRYEIDNSDRHFHGALLDARILADVYLAMTGGQVSMVLETTLDSWGGGSAAGKGLSHLDLSQLRVVKANADELVAHEERLVAITKSAGKCLWVV